MRKEKTVKSKLAEMAVIGVMVAMGSIPTAFAQDRGGNGGKGFIGQFEFNVEQIQGWLERGNLSKVDLSGMNPVIDSKKMAVDVVYASKQVLNHTIKLEFVDEEQKVGDEVRTCKNFREQNLIRCNNEQWKTKETPESRYLVTMHELISIAGYEENDGVASEFKVSRKILPYVAPATTYVLTDNEVERTYPGVECSIDQRKKILGKTFLKRLIVQANETGARVLLLDKSGVQQSYELKTKTFSKFSDAWTEDYRSGDFGINLDNGAVMNFSLTAALSKPSSTFVIYIKDASGDLFRTDGSCTPVNFRKNDYLWSEDGFFYTGVHYEVVGYQVTPEKRVEILEDGVQWIKKLGKRVTE